MISQFFILSSRGDTIAFREYRGDVVKGTAEIFYRKIKSWPGSLPPPIFNVEGNHFIYIRRNGLYFVCTTKFNVAPTFVVELLTRISGLCKDYCGVLNEEAIRLNFVLVYELLDEVLDFGYPQVTSTEALKACVLHKPVEVATEPTTSRLPGIAPAREQRTLPSSAANKSVAFGSDSKGDEKHELFVDLLERMTVLIGANGSVLRADIDGSVQMKSFLAGNPEIRLGLSEDIVVERSSTSPGAIGVTLDDCNFHQCVRMEEFEKDRTLAITPPDGEFTAMRYRLSGDFRHKLPFQMLVMVEDNDSKSLEVVLKLRCDIPQDQHATNVAVRFPVPKATTSVSHVLPSGSSQVSEFKSAEKLQVWKMRRCPGGMEQSARFRINVSEKGRSTRKEIGPVNVEFEVPMFLCSGIAIRYLRVIERNGRSYTPFRWVRYITHSDSYVIRI
ncbi:uncharacterized protein LOC135814959 [Sycon ciliatum]|uniref:uncharacterized protein LOC135814959 n=1 Tax=Sycon ciliatum TaxID=27933 RepID=UPI0020AA6237|eukprot:scpid54065/ scgid19698/ AP-4 complex subunit mu-1; AP-4 adapter complex mu subunit; Adapter-related protein complex 4 mu-1 subunit; Mu subunit of AP-4; Mu-adaptin-related protein 2; Mu4-adaptin